MRYLCNGCNLNDEIEAYRKKLNTLVVKKNVSFLDEEVLECSQTLDQLICGCVFCEKNMNMDQMIPSA